MGNRAQVIIQEFEKDAPVVLYTHWGADTILEDVKAALKKKWRWNDYGYLARIILDCMKGKDTESETGFGISTYANGDCVVTIKILPNNMVEVNGIGYDHYIKSFEDFIK